METELRAGGDLAPADEAGLVSRAAQGDQAALGALYDRYFDRVYGFVFRMLRSHEDTEDVVSDAWLKAAERLGSLADPGAFKGWLFAIARNAALDLIGRRRRETALPEDVDPPADPGAAPSPEAAAEATELREFVWEAAETFLNPRDRSILELSVVQELDSGEIAEALDVKPSHAYVLVNRLKGRLQDALGSELLVRFARSGRRECPELQELVRGAEPEELRGLVQGHTKACGSCKESRKRYAALALPLLLQGAAVAATAIPRPGFKEDLRGRVLDASSGGGSEGAGRRPLQGAVAALVVAVVVGAGTLLPARSVVDDRVELEDVGSRATPAATIAPSPSPAPSADPVVAPTRTPRPTRPPRVAATPRPEATPLVVVVTPGTDDGDTDRTEDVGEPDPTPRPTATPDPQLR